MLDKLKTLLSKQADTPSGEPDPERVRMATCVLLMEVAKADEEFSSSERERIVATLRERFTLSQSEADELIEVSATRRGEHHDIWHFTRPINEACSVPEKLEIIEEVWRVIYADGTLEAHEDYLVHKLAKLLNLNHPQLIEAKMNAKEGL